MPAPSFSWADVDSFLDRASEQARLERWWNDSTREPLAMIGRRRVGKSWLFRKFAHGKPAVILVADQLPGQLLLGRFAEALEPVLGVRPELPDVQTLFRVLYRMARDDKILVVIDEFPWLLGGSDPGAHRTLTSIQAIMEDERDTSRLKLIVCGSQVSQMETLFSEKNPMHGRLERLVVSPLKFAQADLFLTSLDPIAAFERFAIAGGMPRYLAKLGRGHLRKSLVDSVLSRDSLWFNEGRAIVEQELREPRVYFALLGQLAAGAKPANEIADRIGIETGTATKYLGVLVELRLVSKHLPFGADPTARSVRWRLDDEFLRFWFRFVFPFQADLEAGLDPAALYDTEIAPAIAGHVAPVFENWCLQWLRADGTAGATRFGTWWGNSVDKLRQAKERSTEEIDAVGSARNRVVVVAEAKWTTNRLTPAIVDDIERFKIPALRQSGQKVADRPEIVLFSKSGYSTSLLELAERRSRITLVDVPAALRTVRDSATEGMSPRR